MTESEKAKNYLKSRIKPIKRIKYASKYLSFESGCKMLELNNIRLTPARDLSDSLDCHHYSIDFSGLRKLDLPAIDSTIDKLKQEWSLVRNWGICSLGKEHDNQTLWEWYASSDGIEDGICIVLDLNKTIDYLISEGHEVVAYEVTYEKNIQESIPAEAFYFGDKRDKMYFFSQLISTKNEIDQVTSKCWKKENEVRLISVEEQSQPILWQLSPECISKIYYGKDMAEDNISELKRIVNLIYPNIKVIRHW